MQAIRFEDGSGVYPRQCGSQSRWCAYWEDRTPLRNHDDTLSYFDSAEEAIEALAADGRGRISGFK